jgi:SAM-dependent methyltransferase
MTRMHAEIHGLGAFYESPCGRVAARFLAARFAALWPQTRGMSVLGLGWAAPYLPLWSGQAARCVALVPPELGAPEGFAPGCVALGPEERLPFADLCFDRVLIVHGLEAAENARRLLREVWRVLRDDGRVIVAVPNRRGLWAQFEHTPLGHGQPYSPGQVQRLLTRQMFAVERRDAALFWPPFPWAAVQGVGAAWERTGQTIWPGRYAGMVIAEARKDLFAGIPAEAVSLRRTVFATARE